MPNSLKALIPALQNKTYFNYGGQGPLPKPSLKAITQSWEVIQELGPFTNDVWPYISSEVQKTKEVLAAICGVKRSQIAFTENVTTGCIAPLWGLPFEEGDHILISDCEHPGIVAACKELAQRKRLLIDILPIRWIRNGVEKEQATIENVLNRLNSSLHSKTKLIVLSHVLWNTGQIMPIKEVATAIKEHVNKPYILVDAAQSFCQIPIQEVCSHSDIYAFTGHKWAFGPEGLGGVALSQRVIEESNPTLIGWKSLKTEVGIHTNLKDPFHSDGRRFEVATSCIPLLSGLRTSLRLLSKEGSDEERIEKIKKLSQLLWRELKKINSINIISEGAPPSGLISFSLKKTAHGHNLVKDLGAKGLWIRMLEDPAWLRACVHITTEEEEIYKLTEGIKRLRKLY